MKLNEVFEQAYPWKWDHKSNTSMTAEFVTDADTTVYVEFSYDGDGQWEVDFGREETTQAWNRRDKAVSAKITGQGDAFRIYATLIDMIQDFVRHQDFDALVFTAHETSRKDLYKRILPKLAKLVDMDYKIVVPKLDPRIKREPHHLFYLVKK